MFSVRPGNVATPRTAVTAVVPPSADPPGLAPSATVTLPLKPVTSVLSASCSSATTAGAIAAPATRDAVGCCVMTHVCTALNAVAVTVSDGTPALAIPSVWGPTMEPSVHVATARPAASVTAEAGVTVPPPVATVKFTATPAFALPFTSVTSAAIGASTERAAMVWPPPPSNTRLAAAPGTMLNVGVVTGVRLPAVACSA